jgi:uncharacterized membrane protein (UPF0136 family)
MVVRHAGLMIAGGILSGLGLGLLLVTRHVFPETGSAGIIILALGAGFLVISPLSMLFSNRTQLWPLLPGSLLALIGMLLLIGSVGLDILSWARSLWPLILIVLGGYFLWEVYRRR